MVVDPDTVEKTQGQLDEVEIRENGRSTNSGRRLGRNLSNAAPNIKAIMTLNSDHFVSLGGRVRLLLEKPKHTY